MTIIQIIHNFYKKKNLISNKFNLKRYENDIQNNLIEKVVFDINQFLYQLEK